MARVVAEIGDVLILRTTKTSTIHVVGLVTRAGQQDLAATPPGHTNPTTVSRWR